MKESKLLIMLSVMLVLFALASCEGIDGHDPPPQFTTMLIYVEYDGLDEFQGELSRIGVFVTSENGYSIVRHADKINKVFAIDVRPGKYTVSAEYIDADADNIILDQTQVQIRDSQTLEIQLKINLNKLQNN